MKAKAQIYRGIEFINVSDLPANQQLLLRRMQEPERIKILMDGKMLDNCIQYKDYGVWYTSVYIQSVIVPVKSIQEEVFQASVALNKV